MNVMKTRIILLFSPQVNQFLNWLQETDSEEEEEGDD